LKLKVGFGWKELHSVFSPVESASSDSENYDDLFTEKFVELSDLAVPSSSYQDPSRCAQVAFYVPWTVPSGEHVFSLVAKRRFWFSKLLSTVKNVQVEDKPNYVKEAPEKAIEPNVAEEAPEDDVEPNFANETPEDATEPNLAEEVPEDDVETNFANETPEDATEPNLAEEAPEDDVETNFANETPEDATEPKLANETPEDDVEPNFANETPEDGFGPNFSEEAREIVIQLRAALASHPIDLDEDEYTFAESQDVDATGPNRV
jgi:hypothetical protein